MSQGSRGTCRSASQRHATVQREAWGAHRYAVVMEDMSSTCGSLYNLHEEEGKCRSASQKWAAIQQEVTGHAQLCATIRQ